MVLSARAADALKTRCARGPTSFGLRSMASGAWSDSSHQAFISACLVDSTKSLLALEIACLLLLS
jgi:hypothetical protein